MDVAGVKGNLVSGKKNKKNKRGRNDCREYLVLEDERRRYSLKYII